MTTLLSIVIPTRHRPDYVREALRYAMIQRGDFEVIVSDNFVDPTLSVRRVVDKLGRSRIRYFQPPNPLGMVDNWNFALSQARGDYILFFTDKTFLLPDTVSRLTQFLESMEPEIVNWTSDDFFPAHNDHPFLAGSYTRSRPSGDLTPERYDPLNALSFKGRAEVPRSSMSAVDYVRGKICFGAYKRSLIKRIDRKYGSLFKPLSPDYTSMILALSEAKSAVDLGWAGSVQLNTNISTGMLGATNDEAAKRFLEEIGSFEAVMKRGLAPGVYSSTSANVAFDYLNMKVSFGLSFDIDRVNWLAQSWMDLRSKAREWSSKEVELTQTRALDNAIERLPAHERHAFDAALAALRTSYIPATSIPSRRRARGWIKNQLARSGFGFVLTLAAHAGVLKSFYSLSLQDAVRLYSGARP